MLIPAPLRQRGNQSRRVVEIAEQIANGVLISHILNIKVSNEPPKTQAQAIRRRLKELIYNQQHLLQVMHNGQPFPVGITWTMNNVGRTCAYYYAVNLPYVDVIVENHTRLLLNGIMHQIRQDHPAAGNDWGLAYMVVKPLSLFQPIVPAVPVLKGGPLVPVTLPAAPQAQLVQDCEGEDEEDDEEEEE
ncbi:hypothetical protein EON64_07650 [archaeon]|nr:MAG: hypothetical protein EON64_07650 [archaeon]